MMSSTSTNILRLLMILVACFCLFLIIAYFNKESYRSSSEPFAPVDDSGMATSSAPDIPEPIPTYGGTAKSQPQAFSSEGGPVNLPPMVPPMPDPASFMVSSGGTPGVPRPVEEPNDEMYRPVEYGKGPRDFKSSFPKDRLAVEDLLPNDAANTAWAQANPAGQGDIKDQNFLTAGFHIGINTVGQSLRNPNLQLRSEPPNPQVKQGPWNQSTIEPDINRRPFDIDSGC